MTHMQNLSCPFILAVDLDVGFDCKFVGVAIGFLGVTIGFLVDLDFSIAFALDLVDLALDLNLDNVVRDLEECQTPQLYHCLYRAGFIFQTIQLLRRICGRAWSTCCLIECSSNVQLEVLLLQLIR